MELDLNAPEVQEAVKAELKSLENRFVIKFAFLFVLLLTPIYFKVLYSGLY